VDGGWRISGGKHFISNGPVASLYFLFAQTNSNEGVMLGSTCFLIERDSPGFTIGRVHDKMGERLTTNAELNFTDCFVPDENVLGEVDRGHQARALFSLGSSVHAAALVLGVAATAYERAIEWTRDRVQGGKPIIEHQAVGLSLSRMKMLLTTAQVTLWHAAWGIDEDPDYRPCTTYWTKAFITQACREVAEQAMELMGGSGVMRETGMEKHVRDVLCMFHVDGGRDITLLKAVKYL
ncbi:MAG: acyl-CoA dehydrogenase, partial [Nitrospinota bacterium]|nr:acyl-CoA dehydrogenase [Nitrospinota bacterium]